MATINETPLIHNPTADEPRLSAWQKLVRSCKQKWYKLCMESPVVQVLCCIDASEGPNYERDMEVRRDIRAAMREQMGFYGNSSCLESVMHETKRDTGYCLGAKQETYKTRTFKQWEELFEANNFTERTPREVILAVVADGRDDVKIVPRFAAAVVVHMRSKFGILAKTEANQLLVQRKYLEICREHRVRDANIACHLQAVMNAYFTEDVLERLAKTRLRAPRWMRMFEEKERAAILEVC